MSAIPSPGKHHNIVKIAKNKKITLFHCYTGNSSPFRDPQNDPEASLLTIIAPECNHCTRNMFGTTFVSHTQPWKTPQHRQNRENKKITCFSLSHREIAIASPFRDPKNNPEASISPESALMCTQCARNMLGTTFVSHTKHWKTPEHRQNREKQENHVVSLWNKGNSGFRDS